MSDTPETDKAERMAFAGEYMVPTEFARELERQRDGAMKDARLLSERLTALELISTNDLAALEIERDEARAWAERLQNVAMQHSIRAESAERERDKAREVLREIAEASHFDNIGNWARNKAKEALE